MTAWADRFQRAPTLATPRIIASSDGEVGTGKTQWWLGAPAPIVIQSLDKGLEGVVEPFAAKKDIHIAEYEWMAAPGAPLLQEHAIELREQFIKDFEQAIKHARTVVWDKENDVYDLFKYAEFGPEREGVPKNWDGLKQRLRRLINLPKSTTINFGMIRGMRNEWVPGPVNKQTGKRGIVQTGNRIPAGMEDVEGLAHINLHHDYVDGQFTLRVGSKVRGPGAATVQGQTFAPSLSFVEFAMLVFPQTTEADWS